MKRITIILLMLVLLMGLYHDSRAQGQELLTNPSFETYYGVGGNGNNQIPIGWKLTSSVPVSSSGHTWPGESRTGASWQINAGSTTFTATGYQQVIGVRSGSQLRFSAWSNIFTCNNNYSCISGNSGHRVSDQGSGARTRIGVDPMGGTDPNAASVQWSQFIAPFDVFQQATIDFQAQNDTAVTVFMYATQSSAMLLNYVYWDDASLQLLQPGEGPTPLASPTPAVQYAPMVQPQTPQADGSIVHIVGPGDTLSSIAYAYKVTVDDIRKLNNLSPDYKFLQIGQKLIIKEADSSAGDVAATDDTSIVATGAATMASTEASTEAVALADTATTEPSNTPTVEPSTTPTKVPTAAVCLLAFEDTNSNQLQDTGEANLPGVKLKLMNSAQVAQTATSTADSSSCFNDLDTGTYTAMVVPPTGYVLTTASELAVDVKPGVELELSFGLIQGAATQEAVAMVATPAPTQVSSNPNDVTLSISPKWILAIGAGIVLLMLVSIGGTVFVLMKVVKK